MAEPFGGAMRRYIGAGYTAPEAMRAAWHDVKIGRVARPTRRGVTARRRQGLQARPTNLIDVPVRRLKGSPGMFTTGPQRTRAVSKRAAARILRGHPLAVGKCVELPAGRLFCRDRWGYYVVARSQATARERGTNPLTRTETARVLRAARGAAHLAATSPPGGGAGVARAFWTGKAERGFEIARSLGAPSRSPRGGEYRSWRAADPLRRTGRPRTNQLRPVVRECAWHPQYFGARHVELLDPLPHGMSREAFIGEAERQHAITHGVCARCKPKLQAEVRAARRRNPTVVPGQKVRTWGGWYRHDRVMEQGKEIGRIQVRRRPRSGRLPGRIESLTLEPAGAAPGAGGAVLGTDVDWLVRRARERGEINPNPTIRAAEIRPGDVILPPARELSLWMRRHLRERGLPESALELTVEGVREGAPDKRGLWLIVTTRQSPAWLEGRTTSSPFTFKVRPASPWPLLRRARGEINPPPYTASSPEIRELLRVWHEAGRPHFERSYRSLDYDAPPYQHVAKDRRKYIALDQGDSGKFLVDKGTGEVYSIKGYGVPNRRLGTLGELTADYAASRRDPYGRRLNPRRNPVAGLEGFALTDRRGWEQAIRDVGGLKVSRQDRGDFAELPGYLKGYRKGVAPDELVQMIADERGLEARHVERAMLAAFHAPRRRRPAELDDYERREREAIQAESRRGVGEARPRVGVGADTFTLRPRSPFKGQIRYVNPELPPRTADTMSEAIALSSPSGRMSKRARAAAERRLSLALFGPGGLQRAPVPQPSPRERLLRQAAQLRDLATRGMKPRAYAKEAARLERQAAALPNPPRFKVGDRAVIADPVRIATRFWSTQHRGIVGAGGTILPRQILDRPAVIASAGAGGASLGKGVKRVLLDWGMDDQNRSLGIWLDSDQLARANPPARLTKFYDGITEVRGVKGRAFGFRPGTRFKHPFTSRPRAYGVDHGGTARLRRGDVVLRGRRSIYAQLGA